MLQKHIGLLHFTLLSRMTYLLLRALINTGQLFYGLFIGRLCLREFDASQTFSFMPQFYKRFQVLSCASVRFIVMKALEKQKHAWINNPPILQLMHAKPLRENFFAVRLNAVKTPTAVKKCKEWLLCQHILMHTCYFFCVHIHATLWRASFLYFP